MSTNVRIKQKALFKKKLEMKDIVALTGLAYGISDDNYRLIRNEMAENTLIYDENRLARGIDLWLDGTDILLSLSLPTTRSEIWLFYHVITIICNELTREKITQALEEMAPHKFVKSAEAYTHAWRIIALSTLTSMQNENFKDSNRCVFFTNLSARYLTFI